MNVAVTPDSEANIILSSLASSKLRLCRDVALAGESVPYRQAKLYYRMLNLDSLPLAGFILSSLQDDAISIAMTNASLLDRVCATVDTEPVKIIRPNKHDPIMSDPIIFDDSQPIGSESNKEP